MIEQTKWENNDGFNSFDIHCDWCEHTDIVDDKEWREMISKIKADGWKISKSGSVWKHKCPDCVLDEEI